MKQFPNIMTNIDDFADSIKKLEIKTKTNNKKIEYLQICCSFDIETSSFIKNDEKCAVMYAFMVNIQHKIYFGRTWEDFCRCIEAIQRTFELHSKRRIIIYVHNLSYEFQFMCKYFHWDKVFALDERKVVYCITDGIEFRCSYILSGYSLDALASIYNLPVKKLVGHLDYKLIRLTKTSLTDKEIEYLLNDVEVVVYYIELILKDEYSIDCIPITKTAYVRRLTKKNCNTMKYRKTISNLTINYEEYQLLKRAFQGGFTHANMFNAGKIHENVSSYDFTSSYPAVMISEMFPMSRGKIEYDVNLSKLEEMIKYFCCVIEIEYSNIESCEVSDHPISSSKCKIEGYRDLDNGRVVRAEKLKTVITEQDYLTIKEFYTYDEVKISRVIKYYKAYLPKEFVNTILDLYIKKTELKNVENREMEYLQSKEMINSMYGMTVTDILRDEIIFDEEWSTEEKDPEKVIDKYNKSKSRFLFYAWGVWVTAYARRNLFTAIKELKEDYIYADTDSVKFVNKEKHMEYFNNYNLKIKNKIIKALKTLGLEDYKAHPKTIKGEEKWLGVWDFDGHYDKFKTLGAKRYMVQHDGIINITVSGLNKKVAVPYILKESGVSFEKQSNGNCKFTQVNTKPAFDYFDDGMYIPKGKTGKNIHTYIDYPIEGYVEDYMGIKQHYKELSCIHLDEAEYSLTMADSIINILKGVVYR